MQQKTCPDTLDEHELYQACRDERNSEKTAVKCALNTELCELVLFGT